MIVDTGENLLRTVLMLENLIDDIKSGIYRTANIYIAVDMEDITTLTDEYVVYLPTGTISVNITLIKKQ